MASSFTWLDHSEIERRKALDVISLFREQETRDELGIGSVRDAFADMLFPGTSTIQTRARYFFFVSWIYRELEERRVAAESVAARARRMEVGLIEALAASEDPAGTIGIQARATLKRLPSNIYWQGLGVLGIRLFKSSQDQYHRSLDRFYSLVDGRKRSEGEPGEERTVSNWHPGLLGAPESFPKKASFRLTEDEAEYLRERIMSRAPGTLFAFLVDEAQSSEPVDFVWAHPQFADFPVRVQEQLEHGRNFSEAIQGAALLYNLMLSEKAANAELIDDYSLDLREWRDRLVDRQVKFNRWDRNRFWVLVISRGARVAPQARLFIDTWLDLAMSARSNRGIAVNKNARQLILERERSLKGPLARLENPRALELWNGAAGLRQLDYRWGIAQSMVTDIRLGLARGNGHA